MTKWSVYQSDRRHENQERSIVNTFELIINLLFNNFNDVVTINRRRPE